MDACHRGRLHQLNAKYRAYRCAPFRGIKHQHGKWSASIKDPRLYLHDGRCHIGTFNSPETAAAAYDFALIALGHPPFNFNLQHYRDSYPERALRASLAAVKARLRLA